MYELPEWLYCPTQVDTPSFCLKLTQEFLIRLNRPPGLAHPRPGEQAVLPRREGELARQVHQDRRDLCRRQEEPDPHDAPHRGTVPPAPGLHDPGCQVGSYVLLGQYLTQPHR